METGRENSSNRRPGARPQLFISYRRRSDTSSAHLLRDKLTLAFGEGTVFWDVREIQPGEAFPETIRKALADCDVLLPLVSPGWVESMGRLHDPDDLVRHEIAAALARGVPLIPLLLGGARMPKADELPEEIRDLAFRQALELSDDRWDYDVERLVKLVRARAGLSEPVPFFGRLVALRSFLGTWPGRAAAAAAVVAVVLLAAPALWRLAAWYERRQSFDGCVGWYAPDVLGGVARIEVGKSDAPVVPNDEYKLTPGRRDESGGLQLIVTLTDSGREVGAVFLRFQRADVRDNSSFKVERIMAPPCDEVQDYRNESRPAADKRYLNNWDTLRVTLGESYYYLRPDDHGDYVTASLTSKPKD